jgi:nicotinamidase-related amidase
MPIDLTELLKGNELIRGRPSSLPIAVLTMELQRGVMGDLASFPQLADAAREVGVADHAGQLLATMRRLGLPVVHCTASFRRDRADTIVNTPLHSAVLRNEAHLLEGSEAVELIPELDLQVSDLIVDRHYGVSPFLGTALDATLRHLGARVLLVTGVSVNLGVVGLCIEAANLGYQVVVASDAVCGVPVDYGRQVLDQTLSLVATIATTGQICTAAEEAVASADNV